MSTKVCAQNDFQFNKSDIPNYNIDSLRLVYGKNKKFLKEYEFPSLLALSYYPELLNESIIFKYESINCTAKATMTFLSVLKKRGKHYLIVINNNNKTTGMVLSQVPLNAQVALIAHELAHIVDFTKRNFSGMALWGISYLFPKHRAGIEKKADKMVISKGLGMDLYNWIDYVLNTSTANKSYLKMKRTTYLSPIKILAEIKKNNQ